MSALVVTMCLLVLLVRTAGADPVACEAAPDLVCRSGRSGGQTLQGGVEADASLTLKGPGQVRVEGGAIFSPTMPDASGSLMTLSPTQRLHGRRIVGLDMSPAFRWTSPGAFCGIRFGGIHDVDVDPAAVNFMSALQVNYVSRSTTNGVAPWFPDMILEQWTAQMDGPGRSATTGLIPIGFGAEPSLKATNGASLSVVDRCAMSCGLGMNKPCRPASEATDCAGCAGGTERSCTERGGLITLYSHPTLHADGASSLSLVRRAVVFDRGVRFEAAGGGAVTLSMDNTMYIADRSGADTTRAIESQLTAGNRKFFLYAEGDAPSVHAGSLRIGGTAPPQRNLDVTGDVGVSGGLRVGDANPPGAAIDLAAGRDRYLRMAGAALDPAAPAPGDVWYNTALHAHRTHALLGTLGLVGVFSTITSDSRPITNTTAETLFSNGAVPVPASSLAAGKTIRIRAGGRYSSHDAVAPRLTVRWGTGTTSPANLLVETGTPTLAGEINDGAWTLDADITVRSIGPAGGAAARGSATFDGPTGAAVLTTDRKIGVTTIDTTAATSIAMLAMWKKPTPADSITLEVMTVEVLD